MYFLETILSFLSISTWSAVSKGAGKNSKKEAKFISTYLNKNNINSQILTVNKDKVSKKSMNEARNNRYNLLTNFCIKNNFLHLFIAHHKEDNLETFLNRKIAGSDFYGLVGIGECGNTGRPGSFLGLAADFELTASTSTISP